MIWLYARNPDSPAVCRRQVRILDAVFGGFFGAIFAVLAILTAIELLYRGQL